MTSFINQKKEEIADIDKKIFKSISAHKEELKKASAGQKKEITKKIEELKLHNEEIQKELQNSIDTPFRLGIQSGPGYYSNQEFHGCSKCSYSYIIDKKPFNISIDPVTNAMSTIVNTYGPKGAKCPKCGNVDEILG